MIAVISSGHRHGPLNGVVDCELPVSEWPRPPRELRGNNGTEPLIQNWVLASNPLIPQVLHLACEVLELRVETNGEASLHVQCADGKHRSVAAAELLAKVLRERGNSVTVVHRDLVREQE